jgi:hypothetical protein
LVHPTSSLRKQLSQKHLTPPTQMPNRANVLIVTDEVDEGTLRRATNKCKVIYPCPNKWFTWHNADVLHLEALSCRVYEACMPGG